MLNLAESVIRTSSASLVNKNQHTVGTSLGFREVVLVFKGSQDFDTTKALATPCTGRRQYPLTHSTRTDLPPKIAG